MHSQRWLCTIAKKVKKIYIYILYYFIMLVVMVFVYCSRYIILLCYFYYFIVLNAKIKPLMLDVL